MQACRSCGAPVTWVTLINTGKKAPLDTEPSTGGNIRMLAAEQPAAKVLTKTELAEARAKGELLYTNHFVGCPDRKQWRKR